MDIGCRCRQGMKFEIRALLGYSGATMDIKQIAFDLKTGTPESITAMLKGLFESQTDCSSKILFEVLYDLKFHRDPAVVFWAKKLLNKIDVTYSFKGVDPATVSRNTVVPPPEEPPPPPSREEILAKIASEPAAVTVEELKIVCENPDETVKEPLLALLESQPDESVLSFLTKHLGQSFPDEEMLIRLAPYLRHEDSRVVANTVEGLQSIRSRKTFVLLTQLLSHEDNRVRSNVAIAIGEYDRTEAMGIVERMLRLEGKAHMQASACHAVRVLNETRLFPVLIELFADPFLFREALGVFEGLPGAESVQTLESVLEQTADDDRKQEIAASIGRIRQSMENALKPPPRKTRFAPWVKL